MADLGFEFNAADIEPSTPFEVIPAGKYHVQIVNSELRDTKSGTGRYLWLELSIMDGAHANKRLFERLNIVNQNQDTVNIAKRQFSAICHAVGQLSLKNTEQLHNRSLIANVKVRPEGPDKSGVMRNASNEISGYLPMSGAPQTAALATRAPAAAPATSAATTETKAPPWRRNVA